MTRSDRTSATTIARMITTIAKNPFGSHSENQSAAHHIAESAIDQAKEPAEARLAELSPIVLECLHRG